ncbi:MAG: hypothetical protein EDX89_18755 [Acidobacteria bacterium]|nr:MAG: hypothetical protein EDX89_18755 [Acidobacteriota bacterium]MCE7957698.1 hypothetical protein [Acidobacteria bacterium ACB2]
MSSQPRAGRKPRPPADPFVADFGPEPEAPPFRGGPGPAYGPIPGIACAGEACLLRPVAGLVERAVVRISKGHVESLSHAAWSGIELMKAIRDFLDEEIEIAERAAKASGAEPRFRKIEVE